MEIKVKDNAEEVINLKRLASATLNTIGGGTASNPWSSDEIDKLEFSGDFYKTIDACRFFYKKDPIVASTINKLVEIGINKLNFSKNGLSENEFKIFTSIQYELEQFAEIVALEYLISGLVVPEITFGPINSEKIKPLGIKKYSSLMMPISMYVRDPKTIKD